MKQGEGPGYAFILPVFIKNPLYTTDRTMYLTIYQCAKQKNGYFMELVHFSRVRPYTHIFIKSLSYGDE